MKQSYVKYITLIFNVDKIFIAHEFLTQC